MEQTIKRVLSLPLKTLQKLKFCYIGAKKIPHKRDGTNLKVNNENDFFTIDNIISPKIFEFLGVGISVNFSKIAAVDIDKCIDEQGNISNNALEILQIFNETYSEISFSGTGIRILFYCDYLDFEKYKNDYYIKNQNNNIEFYNWTFTHRYVSLTGNRLNDKDINFVDDEKLYKFLNSFMKRKNAYNVEKLEKKENNNYDYSNLDDTEIIKQTTRNFRYLLLNDLDFQELYFSKAPGSGKNESELDYVLLSYFFDYITDELDTATTLIEASPYYISKDWKHKQKWNNGRYVENTWKRIISRKK